MDAFPKRGNRCCCLEFQTAFSGRVGERLDPTVVLVVTAVQFDRFDPGGRYFLSNCLADHGRCVAVATIADTRPHILIACAGAGDRLAR